MAHEAMPRVRWGRTSGGCQGRALRFDPSIGSSGRSRLTPDGWRPSTCRTSGGGVVASRAARAVAVPAALADQAPFVRREAAEDAELGARAEGPGAAGRQYRAAGADLLGLVAQRVVGRLVTEGEEDVQVLADAGGLGTPVLAPALPAAGRHPGPAGLVEVAVVVGFFQARAGRVHLAGAGGRETSHAGRGTRGTRGETRAPCGGRPARQVSDKGVAQERYGIVVRVCCGDCAGQT